MNNKNTSDDTREFTIPGEAVPKARPRVLKSGFTYTPKRTADFEQRVRNAYEQAYGGLEPITCPVAVIMEFTTAIPKSYSAKKRQAIKDDDIVPQKRPDIDNLIKGVLDALNGIAYADDKQVWSVYARKWYGEPRTRVHIAATPERACGKNEE